MGTDIGECVIDVTNAEGIGEAEREKYGERIRRAVLDAANKNMTVASADNIGDFVGKPKIRLVKDSSLEPCECSVFTDESGVVLAAGSTRGFENSISLFESIIGSKNENLENIFYTLIQNILIMFLNILISLSKNIMQNLSKMKLLRKV